MKKTITILILTALFISALTAYSKDVQKDIKDSVIRLHILAQSDSKRDQSIKLSVRDAVLDAAGAVPADDTERFTAAAERAANEYLISHNIPYRARAEYGMFDFPRKSYGGVTLPAGKYRSVRIILGSGGGHNWWCIMYPPLCASGESAVADNAAMTDMKKKMRDDTYDVVTQKPRVKFRIIELIGAIID